MKALPLPMPMAGTLRSLWRFALFELAWFAGVAGAGHGHEWAGIAVVAAVVAAHVHASASPRHELGLIALALALGLVFDGGLAYSGWARYAGALQAPALPPAWILAQWALFATLLREPLRWLHARLPLAALLGALGGPLAYLGGERLSAVQLADRPAALAALALGWALATPLMLAQARRGLPEAKR